MAGYYSSLFGQLAFKFFQTRMADFTLFVGIKKNSFLKLSRMADFTLFVVIKKNSVYNIFGMAVALLRHPGGMKTFHFVTIFSNQDGRLHFVRRHP